MSYLSSLKLHHFRCYTHLNLPDLKSGLIAIHGANGAGKTNILEALSLLSPGRGLRGCRPSEIQKNDTSDPWAIASTLESQYGDNDYGQITLGTGLDPAYHSTGKDKRVIRIQGQNAKSQNALGEHVSCVWLTPQMDRLFLDSAGHRRKFLDRLIFAFDSGHAGRCTRYDNAMSQRSKLLKTGQNDDSWLAGLEAQMVETGVAIAAARLDFIQRLQAACDNADHAHFPGALLKAEGTLEELSGKTSAVDVEDLFAHQLRESRKTDAITGGAATGPHKSDLSVSMATTSMPAASCSTGEQKALLIGIILSHARLIAAERGSPPLILLDEVAAHLDDGRRTALYEILESLNTQIWMTGTDLSLFDPIRDSAQFLEIENAQIKA